VLQRLLITAGIIIDVPRQLAAQNYKQKRDRKRSGLNPRHLRWLMKSSAVFWDCNTAN